LIKHDNIWGENISNRRPYAETQKQPLPLLPVPELMELDLNPFILPDL